MEPSIEIEELIRGWFEATANGDASWRDRYVSRHPSLKLVGTEPDDWLEGYSAYKFLKDEAARLGGDVTSTWKTSPATKKAPSDGASRGRL